MAIGAALAALLFTLMACEPAVSRPTPPDPPTPPVKPEQPVAHDHVKVIEDTVTVSAVNNNSVTFADPISYVPGDVIVEAPGQSTADGLLRKVTAVSADGRMVITEQAYLDDVIKSGTLTVEGELTPQDVTPGSRKSLAVQGITVASNGSGSASHRVSFPGIAFGEPGAYLVFDGYIEFSLSYQYQYDPNGESSFSFTLIENAQLTLRSQNHSGNRVTSTMEEFKITLPIAIRKDVLTAIGIVPFWFKVYADIYIGVGATGELHMTVEKTGSLRGGAECTSPPCMPRKKDVDIDDIAGTAARLQNIIKKWKNISSSSLNFELVEARVGSEITGWIRPELGIILYSLAGVNAGLKAYAKVGGEGQLLHGQYSGKAYLDVGVNVLLNLWLGIWVPYVKEPLLSHNFNIIEEPIYGPERLWEWRSPVEPLRWQSTVRDQTYTVDQRIPMLQLPEATGGSGSLSYSLSSRPSGLTFDSGRRRLTGIPAAGSAGTYNMTYTVRDSSNPPLTETLRFTITVQRAPAQSLRWLATMRDQTYTVDERIPTQILPAATGGSGRLSYSLSATPPGLSFDASTRRLTGAPRAGSVGTYNMTYTVRDFSNPPVSLTLRFTITVEPAQAVGVPFRDCAGCPLMVRVPSGSNLMGSSATEASRDADESPRHLVTIAYPLAVGVHEVTFDEWDACVADGGCGGVQPGDDGWGRGSRPVINVSWHDAKAYVRWLSREAGVRYRLLSESEWEYAARAGTTDAWSTGRSINSSQANYGRNVGRTTTVGTYGANAYGLYDVHGNVWEWVEDCYRSSYSGARGDGTAYQGPATCERRVSRGGGWASSESSLRSANRKWSLSPFGLNTQGFRVARDL